MSTGRTDAGVAEVNGTTGGAEGGRPKHVAPQSAARELPLALERHRQMLDQLPPGSAAIDLGVFWVGANCGISLLSQAVAVVAEMRLGLTFTYYPSVY